MRRMSKSPTIHDIAADLKISTTTVWRALNNRDRVSARTRELVRARAEAVSYEPSLVAQNLSHGRTSTLGFLVPRVAHPVFSILIEVFEKIAFDRGYCVILCNVAHDMHREVEYTRMLYRRRVEGVVAIPFGQENRDWDNILMELHKRSIPVVLLEHGLKSNLYSTVVVDNFGAAYQMTRHLISLGHTRLAFASHSGEVHDSIWQERLEGFKKAVADAGLTERAQLILDNYVMGGHGIRIYRPDAILRHFSGTDRPTALFAVMDKLAIEIMETLRQMKLEVPRDVAIAGFDNVEFAQHTVPPLTTVQQPTEEMARRATEILFDQIEAAPGSKIEPIFKRLPCELIIRQSCGAKS
jgi:LacI family transcriptional regulator